MLGDCPAEGGKVKMIIGDRLREMREGKKLSQGDIANARASFSSVSMAGTVCPLSTRDM